MTQPPESEEHGERLAVPAIIVADHRHAPAGSAYRRRRLELGLILLVVATSALSAFVFFTRSTVNRDLIDDAQRVEDCQQRFNEAFSDNLRSRTEAAERRADLTDALIFAVARTNATVPEAKRRSAQAELFADYGRKSAALKAERAKSPLLPYPNCARITGQRGDPR